jgi:hypothetical protein
MLVNDLYKTGRIAFRRGIHGAGRVDARNHDEWAALNPSFAVGVDVIDHCQSGLENLVPESPLSQLRS